MSERRRLTGCGASDHPDPAVAVGEVVGHLQNSLAGSPQFTLVLVDHKLGSLLSTIAGTVHRLLGPDLLLAVAAPHVTGGEGVAPARASVVAWAVCAIDVAALDGDPGQTGTSAGSGAKAVAVEQRSDGSVAAWFGSGPDVSRPLFVSGDGRLWRPSWPGIGFPPGSATVVRGRGHRNIGSTMVATEAHGRTLLRLDHVPVRAVLVDQLETTEAFIDGPSIEFPPLRASVTRSSDRGTDARLLDVVAVDAKEGSIALSGEVRVGDRVQLVAHDRAVAARDVADHVRDTGIPGDRGLLLDGDLGPQETDFTDPIAIATIGTGATGAGGGEPWGHLDAILVHALDDD